MAPEIEVATTERIAGSVAYEMPFGYRLPYCLRMTWDRPDGAGINMFHYPVGPLMPSGSIQFDFQLRSPDESPIPPGLVLAFFALNTVPEPPSFPHQVSRTQALSDTRAVLVELR